MAEMISIGMAILAAAAVIGPLFFYIFVLIITREESEEISLDKTDIYLLITLIAIDKKRLEHQKELGQFPTLIYVVVYEHRVALEKKLRRVLAEMEGE